MKKIYILSAIVLSVFIVNTVNAENLNERLKGRILLQVEDVGQAWYIDPETKERAFLGRPADAFRIMRELGLGISEDSYDSFNGYAPSRLSGKILLRVEANGEAYYVFPDDLKMYYLGRPADAFDIMREKGLGITDEDLNEVPVFEKYKEQVEENASAIAELAKKVGEQQKIIDGLLGNNNSNIPELIPLPAHELIPIPELTPIIIPTPEPLPIIIPTPEIISTTTPILTPEPIPGPIIIPTPEPLPIIIPTPEIISTTTPILTPGPIIVPGPIVIPYF